MKKIFPILFLFATTIGVAQFNVDTAKDKIYFSKDYQVDLSKQRIIEKTNERLVKNDHAEFSIERSANDEKITVSLYEYVLLYDDGYNGTPVVLNGKYNGYFMASVGIRYSMNLSFKENGYSIKVENYTLEFDLDYKDVRMEDYAVTGDYQTYVNKTIKQWENKPDSPTKKAILERILDKEFSKLDFGQRTRFTKIILSEIEKEAVQDAASIFEYVYE